MLICTKPSTNDRMTRVRIYSYMYYNSLVAIEETRWCVDWLKDIWVNQIREHAKHDLLEHE